MAFIKKVPLAISGLALSTAALGNLLLPHGEMIRAICGVLSGTILIIFIAKVILDFENVMDDLKNPAILSVLPTSTMALMLLSAYIKPYVGNLAVYMWYFAILAIVFIMLLFTKRFVIGLKVQSVVPGWCVVSGGMIAASVTSPVMNAVEIGIIIFYVGATTFFITLPIIIYRMIKIKALPESLRPTIAIFTSPISLIITGYFAVFDHHNPLLVYTMLTIAMLVYIYVSINMVSLLQLKFYPSYSAFTFPYVISAIAFNEANTLLVENGYNFFSLVPIISKWIAVIVVIYVLIRYFMFLFSTPTQESLPPN